MVKEKSASSLVILMSLKKIGFVIHKLGSWLSKKISYLVKHSGGVFFHTILINLYSDLILALILSMFLLFLCQI